MTEARAVGGLAGLAVGDALGAPFEGSPPPRRPVREMTGGGRWGKKKGTITDDTLQALAVARSLIGKKGFDPGDMALRLLESYRESPAFFGPTSAAVFEQMLSGVPAEQAALLVHAERGSRSNGSVMRGAPLGIFYRDPVLVREVSIACSRVTHLDPVAGECSALVNVMVSRLSRGASRGDAFHDALSLCGNREVREMLSRYGEFIPEPSLDPLLSTHAALTAFFTAASFEAALISAVSNGGDADTIGALCGALSGSYWGVDMIPRYWIRYLEKADAIIRTAEELWMVAGR